VVAYITFWASAILVTRGSLLHDRPRWQFWQPTAACLPCNLRKDNLTPQYPPNCLRDSWPHFMTQTAVGATDEVWHLWSSLSKQFSQT
jgi:hypothetical protein